MLEADCEWDRPHRCFPVFLGLFHKPRLHRSLSPLQSSLEVTPAGGGSTLTEHHSQGTVRPCTPHRPPMSGGFMGYTRRKLALICGFVLFSMTLPKVIADQKTSWWQGIGLAIGFFVMGFVGGLVVWAVRVFPRRARPLGGGR